MLAERPDFASIRRVLDIGCGPGGWAQEVAFAHPEIEVVGFEKLFSRFARAYQLAGKSFSPEGKNFGITPKLGYFLRGTGYQNIRQTPYIVDYSAGAEAHDATYQDWKIALKLIQPFLITMKVTTQEEADALYEQAMTEMLSNDFTAIVYLLSVWGEKP